MTIVPTGPIDPDYYRNQADRLARTMAIYVADKRRKKDDELAKRRERVKQLYEAVAKGAMPPDSANFEAAVASYEAMDPQGGADIRSMTQALFNQRGYLKDWNRKLSAATAEGHKADLGAMFRSMPEPAQDWLLDSGVVSPEAFFKPPPNKPEPTTGAQAILMAMNNEMSMEEAIEMKRVLDQQEAEKQLIRYSDMEAEERIAEQKAERARLQARQEYSWRLGEADLHERPAAARKPAEPKAETLTIDVEKYLALSKTFADKIKSEQPPATKNRSAAPGAPKPLPQTRINAQGALRAAAVKVAKLNGPALGFSETWAADMSDAIRQLLDEAIKRENEVAVAADVEAQLRKLNVF